MNKTVLAVLGLVVVTLILQFTGVADLNGLLQTLLDTLSQLISQNSV